ncbi:MAG TPA: TIM barrel protein [Burkholderiaceae bacterium]|nr:TIM barrel protein [Burkholderiaceae bacterium]
MPRFAANISLMYPEYPLIERIGAAARDGFAAVEVQFPYEVESADFRRALDAAHVRLVLINAPVGQAATGRGYAALPGHEQEFDVSIERALDYARATGATRVHVMAGSPGAEVPHADALAAYERNLAKASAALAAHGIVATIEPINPYDIPGYFMNGLPLALSVMERLGPSGPALQFDAYHLQIIHGDLIRRLREHIARIGHVQIAGVPARNEPDRGEVNYPEIFRELDALRYAGWVGAEYRPANPGPGGTSAGLGWLRGF